MFIYVICLRINHFWLKPLFELHLTFNFLNSDLRGLTRLHTARWRAEYCLILNTEPPWLRPPLITLIKRTWFEWCRCAGLEAAVAGTRTGDAHRIIQPTYVGEYFSNCKEIVEAWNVDAGLNKWGRVGLGGVTVDIDGHTVSSALPVSGPACCPQHFLTL